MTNWSIICPGQGSQQVGMGRELADSFTVARDVFAEVDSTLSQHLFRLMTEGPDETLRLTENAQPALMAVSIAVLRVLEAEFGFSLPARARYVAGHSLGEYSALCAAGALSLADTARLLRRRGQAMQRAVPVGVGAMAALLGPDFAEASAIAAEAAAGEVCAAANDNAPGQVVVSGHAAAVERAIQIAAGRGFKRSVRLPVSAPFHCSLMQPAAEAMAEALAAVTLEVPAVPLVANITAQPVSDPHIIRRLLVEQVTGMVRWRETIQWLAGQEITCLLEVGAGTVLAGLARRIAPELRTVSVHRPAELVTASKEWR